MPEYIQYSKESHGEGIETWRLDLRAGPQALAPTTSKAARERYKIRALSYALNSSNLPPERCSPDCPCICGPSRMGTWWGKWLREAPQPWLLSSARADPAAPTAPSRSHFPLPSTPFQLLRQSDKGDKSLGRSRSSFI